MGGEDRGFGVSGWNSARRLGMPAMRSQGYRCTQHSLSSYHLLATPPNPSIAKPSPTQSITLPPTHPPISLQTAPCLPVNPAKPKPNNPPPPRPRLQQVLWIVGKRKPNPAIQTLLDTADARWMSGVSRGIIDVEYGERVLIIRIGVGVGRGWRGS